MRPTPIDSNEQQDERLDALAISSTAGICADYPDWPEWLDTARATAADDRLTQLGL
jgi:hypothetical protein